MFIGHFDLTQPLLWTIPELMSAKDCAELLSRAAGCEWLAATVNAAEGRVVREHIRSNTLAIWPDAELARALFARARPKIPETLSGRKLHGLREPLRIYRYEPGQRFGIHSDQAYDGPDGTSSLLTFLMYLNDDFTGGETDFPEQRETVRPRAGTALLFQHMVLHEGCTVTAGTKYVLRSDVLYAPEASHCSAH